MDRRDMLANLMMMAAADGSIGEDEIRVLARRAQRWGISATEFTEAQRNASSDTSRLAIPDEKADRVALLTDLLRVMMADDNLSVDENRLFSRAAATMGVSVTELQEIIELVIDQRRK